MHNWFARRRPDNLFPKKLRFSSHNRLFSCIRTEGVGERREDPIEPLGSASRIRQWWCSTLVRYGHRGCLRVDRPTFSTITVWNTNTNTSRSRSRSRSKSKSRSRYRRTYFLGTVVDDGHHWHKSRCPRKSEAFLFARHSCGWRRRLGRRLCSSTFCRTRRERRKEASPNRALPISENKTYSTQ